jgi:CheY-like chemotaxis protein
MHAELRHAGPALRVLVVDDDRDNADSEALLLRLWGHEARVAYDAADALTQAEAFRPDVVLADLEMPGLDGVRLAERLRQRPRPRPALVAVTGHASPDYQQRCRRAGFHYFLVKPVRPTYLGELLADVAAARVQIDSSFDMVLTLPS